MSEWIAALSASGVPYLEHIVRDTALVAEALMVSSVFRGHARPALISGIWLLVIARLLVPWSILLHLPFESTQHAASPVAAGSATDPGMASEPSEHLAAATGPAAATPSASNSNRIAAVWLTGCLVVLALRLAAHLRFLWALRHSQQLDVARFEAVLKELYSAMRVRQDLRFVESDAVETPCVSGILWPVCVFPSGLLDDMDERTFRHIVAHELAHVKRRDVFVQWLAMVTVSLHWFNPLVWAALMRQRTDAEIAADALALGHLAADDGPEYGETLLRIAVQGRLGQHLAMPAVAGGGSQVGVRIRAITEARAHGSRSTALGTALLLVAAAAAFSQPTLQAPPAADVSLSAAGERWRVVLSAAVSVEFENLAMRDILDFYSGSFEVPLIYSTDSGPGLALIVPQLKMDDVNFAAMLEVTLRQCGLVCVPGKESLWIGTPGEVPEASFGALDEPVMATSILNPGAREQLLIALDSPAVVDLEDLELAETCAFLGESFGINILIDPRAVGTPGYPPAPDSTSGGRIVRMRQKDKSVRAILEAMLGKDGAPMPESGTPAIHLLRILPTPDGGENRALIQTPLSTQWYSVGDSFEYFTLLRIEPKSETVVVQDARISHTLELAKAAVAPKESDVSVTTIKGLDFSVEDGYVWISTPSILRKEAHWYGK